MDKVVDHKQRDLYWHGQGSGPQTHTDIYLHEPGSGSQTEIYIGIDQILTK